jgi:hypothetical protein
MTHPGANPKAPRQDNVTNFRSTLKRELQRPHCRTIVDPRGVAKQLPGTVPLASSRRQIANMFQSRCTSKMCRTTSRRRRENSPGFQGQS